MVEKTSEEGVARGDGYTEVLKALYGARRKGIDLSLDRMESCLHSMELLDGGAACTIQIAGTNGKGSTAICLASILQSAGLRVGVFSSPHLLSLTERFSVDLKAASRDALASAYWAVKPHAEGLTFFEQITAMAAWLFRSNSVDVAIYEVGLGGRLDSTTAISTQVGVVTGIGLDHCEYLGNTLTEIADEKAAIFREGSRAVIGTSAPAEIREQLQGRAKSAGARVWMVGERERSLVPDTLQMRGLHQRENAACAIAAVMALREIGMAIPDASMDAGLCRAEIAGRLQEVEEGLWMDGAHNAQASEALATAVVADAPWVLVVGLSAGKNIGEFLAPWIPLCSHLIATEAANDRACSADEIAAQAHDFLSVEVQKSTILALKRARAIAGEGPILVTGSLLLLGEVLQGLGHGPADPFVVSDPGGSKFAQDAPGAYP
jgi:dihydrofolate synthase/folylpolyglutamate synthase